MFRIISAAMLSIRIPIRISVRAAVIFKIKAFKMLRNEAAVMLKVKVEDLPHFVTVMVHLNE